MNNVYIKKPKVAFHVIQSRATLGLFAISAFLLLTTYYLLLTASTAHAAEDISAFAMHAEIQTNGSIIVQEEIYYNFGDEQKHGIFRTIPLMFRVPGEKEDRVLELSSITVTDGEGIFYPTSYEENINSVKLKIGDPDLFVTGPKLYVIRYTVWGAMNSLIDRDEFYWNVTGNEWPSSIQKTRAEVVFPEPYPAEKVYAHCYVGAFGSTGQCDSATIYEEPETKKVGIVRFEHGVLGPREGLTIAVGIPKGVLTYDRGDKPAGNDYTSLGVRRFWDDAIFQISLLIPFLVFVFMFRHWWKYGRDPRGRGTAIPEYDIPEGLSVLEGGVLYHDSLTSAAISAAIIALAEKGYLRVEHIEVPGVIWNSADYLLVKLKGPDAKISLTDRFILDEIFKTDRVKVSDLAHKLVELKSLLEKTVYGELTEKGYFVKNPQEVRRNYIIAGLAVAFVGLFVPGANLAVILSGLIVLVFGWLMPQLTTRGALAREMLEGFKDYLETAEGDRIRFANAPDTKPELFEQFLPFAMVFGVEEEWAGKFAELFTPEKDNSPSWYRSSGGAPFSAALFAEDMNKFSGATSTAFASEGGASGGGGSSGGGGGGGGGGSW